VSSLRASEYIFSLTLGIVRSMIEAGDDKLTSGVAGGRYKGRSRRSSRPTRPRGACELRRRVFPSGFPHHVEDFDPSHHFARIPTAGGAASAAAAPPRIVTARGGAIVRESTVSTAGIRIRVRKALREVSSCAAQCDGRV
jgi:hypothetical protein